MGRSELYADAYLIWQRSTQAQKTWVELKMYWMDTFKEHECFVPGSSVARLNMRLHTVRFVPLLFVQLKQVENPTILSLCLQEAVGIPQFFECTPPFPVWRQNFL